MAKESLISVIFRYEITEMERSSRVKVTESTEESPRTKSSQTWNAILSDDEGAVSQDDEGEVTTSIRREVNQYLK